MSHCHSPPPPPLEDMQPFTKVPGEQNSLSVPCLSSHGPSCMESSNPRQAGANGDVEGGVFSL